MSGLLSKLLEALKLTRPVVDIVIDGDGKAILIKTEDAVVIRKVDVHGEVLEVIS